MSLASQLPDELLFVVNFPAEDHRQLPPVDGLYQGLDLISSAADAAQGHRLPPKLSQAMDAPLAEGL